MTETLHVTFFEDQYATSLKTAELTLDELKGRILRTNAPTKDALPWLKLAVFGKKKLTNKSRCLRHDANVTSITGIELDYDGMKVGFDQAVELVKEMGIKALVYTSPSHTAAAPKWRLLAPVSKESAPDLRAKLVARVNGFMGEKLGMTAGILENHTESFTLSQSYYYGYALDNAAANHQAMVLDGKFIDLEDKLFKYQKRGDPRGADDGNAFTNVAGDAGERVHQQKYTTHGFEAVLGEMGDGEGRGGFNEVLIRAVASYVGLHNGHPFDHEKLKKLLRTAIEGAPKARNRAAKDISRYLSNRYLDAIITSAIRKFTENMPLTINDFVSYLPTGEYIFLITREMWVGKSINTRIPPIPVLDRQGRPKMKVKNGVTTPQTIKATQWLDKHRAVEQMTWAPGEPPMIQDKLIVHNSGWVKRKGTSTFNMYIPPNMTPGDERQALPWTNHIERIYPEDAKHIIQYLAHKVQHPAEKINHAILLGGAQGIGKDTLLEPVIRSIGEWNFREVNPSTMLGQFNPYLQAVILRINEVRDLGDVSRYSFYEHLKRICAAPPATLQINQKNMREHDILNCCGVIMTTNHKTDGIYLPPDDRRTYVAWSHCVKEDFSKKYWDDIWSWFNDGGDTHVLAYLQALDLADFDHKAPPRLTDAFHTIVNANRGDGESELADLIDKLGKPPALTNDELIANADPDFADWMTERKNRKALSHRLEAQGYEPIRNPDNADGMWLVKGRRKNIYGSVLLSTREKILAAEALKAKYDDNSQNPDSPDKSTIYPFKRPR